MEIFDKIENTQEIKIDILCKYFNGYDGSCLKGDDCQFKHSDQISGKNLCKNWLKDGRCVFGQNCNFFHNLPASQQNPTFNNKIQRLENPKKGKPPTKYPNLENQTKKSEFVFKL